MMRNTDGQSVGAVVIGRNEGDRLRLCLQSLQGRVAHLVYVDSQSSDGSVAMARQMGADVVELDLSVPFTAARARNAGFDRLRQIAPQIELVQFVDGDCEVGEDWIDTARRTMTSDPSIVAVTGLRRERFPEQSIFNAICDVEWQMGGFGQTDRFGGDVMIRARALLDVGGYDPGVIAAEDDEVALRLHLRGGRIMRLNHGMTLHDASIHRLSQWWKRAKRAGYAYAQVSQMHGAAPVGKFTAERRRVLIWGLGVPVAMLGLVPVSSGASLLLVLLYPLRGMRAAKHARQQGILDRSSRAWGFSCTFSCFPELVGMGKFWGNRLLSQAPRIIEYKGPQT